MDISVLFFGILAEIAGLRRKHYRAVSSFSDLRHRVADDFPEMENYSFRIAVNNRLTVEEPLLRDGDEVLFLPPFAGG
jgi:molybdopterin synthase sulfur carrier subunit